jgi:hypothetical protein
VSGALAAALVGVLALASTLWRADVQQDIVVARQDSLQRIVTSQDLLTIAERFNATGNPQLALPLADSALRLDSTRADAFVQRARALVQLRSYAQGLASSSSAIARDTADPRGYALRAEASAGLGDTAAAVRDLQGIVDRVRGAERDTVLAALRRLHGRPLDRGARVYIHFKSYGDTALIRALSRDAATGGYPVAAWAHQNRVISRATVRYFHPEDRDRADSLRTTIARGFRRRGLDLPVDRLDVSEYPAPPGKLELWLPDLGTGGETASPAAGGETPSQADSAQAKQ